MTENENTNVYPLKNYVKPTPPQKDGYGRIIKVKKPDIHVVRTHDMRVLNVNRLVELPKNVLVSDDVEAVIAEAKGKIDKLRGFFSRHVKFMLVVLTKCHTATLEDTLACVRKAGCRTPTTSEYVSFVATLSGTEEADLRPIVMLETGCVDEWGHRMGIIHQRIGKVRREELAFTSVERVKGTWQLLVANERVVSSRRGA